MLKRFWWLPIGRVDEVSPHEFHQWMVEGRPIQVIDARSEPEFRSGTIGKAQHAPVTAMPECLQKIVLDPAKPVVVLCLSGHRSRPGTRWLRAHGYEAYSLQGGVFAWKAAGFQVE